MSDLTREELNSKLEIIETRMDARIGSLEQKMETKFAQIDVRFEQIDVRFDKIDTRFEQVEARLSKVETEIQRSAAETIKWVVGTGLAIATAGITVMTFVLNYGAPRGNALPPAPIVIQIPAYALPAAAAPHP